MTARSTRTSTSPSTRSDRNAAIRARSSARIFALTSSGLSSCGPHETASVCPILRLIDSMGSGLWPRRLRAARPTTKASPSHGDRRGHRPTLEAVVVHEQLAFGGGRARRPRSWWFPRSIPTGAVDEGHELSSSGGAERMGSSSSVGNAFGSFARPSSSASATEGTQHRSIASSGGGACLGCRRRGGGCGFGRVSGEGGHGELQTFSRVEGQVFPVRAQGLFGLLVGPGRLELFGELTHALGDRGSDPPWDRWP